MLGLSAKYRAPNCKKHSAGIYNVIWCSYKTHFWCSRFGTQTYTLTIKGFKNRHFKVKTSRNPNNTSQFSFCNTKTLPFMLNIIDGNNHKLVQLRDSNAWIPFTFLDKRQAIFSAIKLLVVKLWKFPVIIKFYRFYSYSCTITSTFFFMHIHVIWIKLRFDNLLNQLTSPVPVSTCIFTVPICSYFPAIGAPNGVFLYYEIRISIVIRYQCI